MSSYGNNLTEYSPQMETFEFPQSELAGESESGVFGEALEMELASELLEITNEQELDHFLGNLIKKAGSAVGSFVNSPIGSAIGGVLKSAAKKALPIAGGALGAWVGGPLGAKIGSGLASMAGQALGLELEGLSQEDREFEAARQFVRWAGETSRNALTAPSTADPVSIAKAAAAQAARLHAPGLVSGPTAPTPHRAHSGRWIRRGNNVLLIGI
jgi:hypothetical protein